ncbi:MAG: ribonuclease E activity regulator RraA [Pseudomonadales bacterium]
MLSTPDLCDEHPNDVSVCELQFMQFGQREKFSGKIRTVKCFEDNSLVKQILAEPGSGQVLVVDGGGSLRRALLGDQIAASAVKHEWAGLIFYGAVRDVNEINSLAIGVRALGSIPLKTEKLGAGQVDVPISFGGVEFIPGHFIYADNNGVVVCEKDLQVSWS